MHDNRRYVKLTPESFAFHASLSSCRSGFGVFGREQDCRYVLLLRVPVQNRHVDDGRENGGERHGEQDIDAAEK